MIDIPRKYCISLISSTQVLYFKHRLHKKDAPPHNFITFVGNNCHLIIVIITSKVDKVSSLYASTTSGSLIILEPNAMPYLPLESIINCNSPEMYSKDGLIDEIIDPNGPLEVRGSISLDLENRIKNAIKGSLLAKPKIIKALQ